MGARDLGRKALVIQGSREAQAISNSITSQQVFNDPDDCCILIAQTRSGMHKEKHNRLVRQINFSYYTGVELLKPARFIR